MITKVRMEVIKMFINGFYRTPGNLGTKDGSWTTLQNMGKIINTKYSEFCPMLSPYGKFFFFSRNKNDTCDIYWIDAKIIEDFKPRNLGREK
jgi:hypothetical protein